MVTDERKKAIRLAYKLPRLGALSAFRQLNRALDRLDHPLDDRLETVLEPIREMADKLTAGAEIDAETSMSYVDVIYFLIEKEFRSPAAAPVPAA